VAIKRIRAAAHDEAQLRARLQQEARLLAQLGHPAIVQVFDIFDDEGGTWVVMELVEGRTLAEGIEGAIGVGEVLRHGIAIAAALEAAHRQGIIHRDLKVENVMLSASGQIKILDFGLAKQLETSESAPSLSTDGQVLGTVRTMSPEQARGMALDERSDLFSLGVLLYELLAGSSPFAGATPLDTLVRVSTHRQTSLVELPGMAERIPRALSELVDELLEKAIEQRPASAAEVRARLQAMAEARADGAPAGAGAEPVRRRWTDLDMQATEVGTAATVSLKPHEREPRASPSAAVAPAPSSAFEAASEAGPEPRRRRVKQVLLAGLVAAGAGAAVIAMRRTDAGSSATEVAVQSDGGAPADAEPRRDPKAEYERGMALLRNHHRPGTIAEATGIFQRLLREDDRSAAAYAGLATAYWLQYSPDEGRDPMVLQQARAAADRAVALDEFLVDARVSHGRVALMLDQVEQAEKDFQAAVALDGKSAAAYAGLGRVHQRRQHLDEAEAALRKAIALDPDDRGLYDDLGTVLIDRGRYQDAIPLFEKSIALAPDSSYGYSNLGAVYLAQGR
jgi:serine/threonine-protein kinase